MKQFLQFFIPIIWICLALFISSFLLDMMNTANSIENFIGFIGIILVLYISIKLKLGYINFKPKTN